VGAPLALFLGLPIVHEIRPPAIGIDRRQLGTLAAISDHVRSLAPAIIHNGATLRQLCEAARDGFPTPRSAP